MEIIWTVIATLGMPAAAPFPRFSLRLGTEIRCQVVLVQSLSSQIISGQENVYVMTLRRRFHGTHNKLKEHGDDFALFQNKTNFFLSRFKQTEKASFQILLNKTEAKQKRTPLADRDAETSPLTVISPETGQEAVLNQ